MKPNRQKISFSKTVLDNLPAQDRRYFVYDSKVPGLAVLVAPTGAKSFYLYRWVKGKPEWKRLGGYPARAIALCGRSTGGGSLGWRDGIDRMERELMLPQRLDPRPYLANRPDPRRETRNKLHPLRDILMMVLCAVLSGMEDRVGMEIGIGRSLTAPPSHTTGHTDHVSGGSTD